jgi:hypothetical protein
MHTKNLIALLPPEAAFFFAFRREQIIFILGTKYWEGISCYYKFRKQNPQNGRREFRQMNKTEAHTDGPLFLDNPPVHPSL